MADAEVFLVHGPTREVWCGTCHTGAGLEADLYALGATGVQRLNTVTHCPRCVEDRAREQGETL